MDASAAPQQVTGTGPLTPDQERWAEALMVQRIHDERAPLYVAERIGALARVGDEDGVSRWREIAQRLDQLIRPGTSQ